MFLDTTNLIPALQNRRQNKYNSL